MAWSKVGNVRQRGNRWQARYTVNGKQYSKMFNTKTDARQFLAKVHADIVRGAWIDPRRGRITLADYAEHWVASRNLRPRTEQEYQRILRLHILPKLGKIALSQMTPAMVRTWNSNLVRSTSGSTQTAKAYRLLHAIFATAVSDELVARQPCSVKGAGIERPPERPTASVEQVFALSDALGERWVALILLAAFGGLRWGELAALRRGSINMETGTVSVMEAFAELDGGRLVLGPPKTDAGVRTVALPGFVVSALQTHLQRFTEDDPQMLVFIGAKGAPLKRRNFTPVFRRAVVGAKLPEGFHFHDLRHTAGTLYAQQGATMKELMARIGHSSSRAAMIYQHSTQQRQESLASSVDKMVANVMPEKVARIIPIRTAAS
jgi:integrase